MGKKSALTIVAALVVLGASVAASASTMPPGGTIALDDVDDITIGGIGRAVISIGSPAAMTISGPTEAVEQIAVTVDRDELSIGLAANTSIAIGTGEELRFDITVARLEDLRVHDSVAVEVAGPTGEDLEVEVGDAATAVVGDVSVDELEIDVGGSARLVVTGTTPTLELDARGSAAVDASGLVAATAEIEARNSAKAVVNVTDLLEAEVRGSAVVEHVGTPPTGEIEIRDAGELREATGTLLPEMPVPEMPMPGAGPPGSAPPGTGDPGASATTAAAAAEPAGSEATAGATVHEVSLAGRVFTPATLEVSVGDTVTWVNDDDTEHTVTANGGAFDSGELAEGATFSYTFDAPGEFAYRCLFHDGMQGTIVVS